MFFWKGDGGPESPGCSGRSGVFRVVWGVPGGLGCSGWSGVFRGLRGAFTVALTIISRLPPLLYLSDFLLFSLFQWFSRKVGISIESGGSDTHPKKLLFPVFQWFLRNLQISIESLCCLFHLVHLPTGINSMVLSYYGYFHCNIQKAGIICRLQTGTLSMVFSNKTDFH